ncbi:alpha/beta fold hydrolase [Streptomyces justiciae]|uniref:alpha/beta fold hydrolase n=1 Tax=Streptomyces justiciae TaxID=2780140 RepID=UPI0021180D71|nr:alpha/beta hydrolase [Streptomyces justiciae]MCW8378716.1 alpha/beta hydrolase [Streptomyces justiciae]
MTSTPKAPGPDFTEATVTADGFRIRYYTAGEGEPLVVLHGAGGPQLSFALDLLAERFQVLLIEMPGYGDEPNDRTQSFAEMAATLDRATQALGLDSYHLLGTSFGGFVSTHLALNHPERLTTLTLEAPGTFRVGAADPVALMSLPFEVLSRAFRSRPEREPAFQPPDFAVMGKVGPMLGRLMGDAPEYDEQLAERLSKCPVRTLVVFGEDDGVVPPQNGRTFRSLMPDCSYALLSEAAHDVQNDRPEAFAEVVGNFITEGPSFRLPEDATLVDP